MRTSNQYWYYYSKIVRPTNFLKAITARVGLFVVSYKKTQRAAQRRGHMWWDKANFFFLAQSGNKEAREGTARFLFRHSTECSHFIFSNTVCALLRSCRTPRTLRLLRCFHAEAYLGALISIQIVRSGFLNYVTVNVIFKRTRMLRSRSPIVVVQLQTVKNMWNWRNGHQRSFAVRGLAQSDAASDLHTLSVAVIYTQKSSGSMTVVYMLTSFQVQRM